MSIQLARDDVRGNPRHAPGQTLQALGAERVLRNCQGLLARELGFS